MSDQQSEQGGDSQRRWYHFLDEVRIVVGFVGLIICFMALFANKEPFTLNQIVVSLVAVGCSTLWVFYIPYEKRVQRGVRHLIGIGILVIPFILLHFVEQMGSPFVLTGRVFWFAVIWIVVGIFSTLFG